MLLYFLDYLITKASLRKKDLPKSVEAYRKALNKYLAIHDGKLMREFDKLYDLLHIAGYYRGLIYDVNVVKDALKAAKVFIERIN